MKKTSPQNQTEQTLDRFRQGDSEAFASLYHVHWQQVFRFSRLYLKSDDDAEDVVQEMFIRLWQIRERIHPDDNFSGLLFIMTRNMIFNRFRKQLDPLGFKVSVLAALESSDDIESEISARDLSEYIDRLVDLMPTRQRQVTVYPAGSGILLNHRDKKRSPLSHERGLPFTNKTNNVIFPLNSVPKALS